MKKKAPLPVKKSAEASPKIPPAARHRGRKTPADGMEGETREFPIPEDDGMRRKDFNRKSTDTGGNAEDDFSESAAGMPIEVFLTEYRRLVQGYLWVRAKMLHVNEFLKVADFEREMHKGTERKGPREVRVIWNRTETKPK